LLTELVPLIAARLSPVKVLEQSEEILLAKVKVINMLVKRCGEGLLNLFNTILVLQMD